METSKIKHREKEGKKQQPEFNFNFREPKN